MGKQITRAFAAGLLLSAILILIFKPFDSGDKEAAVKKGYVQVKETEYNQMKKEKTEWEEKYKALSAKSKETSVKPKDDKSKTKSDKTKKEPKKDTTKDTAKKETTKEPIVKYQLTIKKGMTPNQIAEKLKAAKIIDHQGNFVEYLIKNKYHEKIQLGDFNVTNEMDYKEIAVIITKGK